MSDMPLNTLVTPAPAGQGPWPRGTGPAPGVRPGAGGPAGSPGGRPGEGLEAGENPFSSLMLGFFQAAQAAPSAAGPGAAGGSPAALAAQPATADLGDGADPAQDPGMALATGHGNGKALPLGGAGLPLPAGLATAAGAGTDGVSEAPAQNLVPATLSSLVAGSASSGDPAAPAAGTANGAVSTTPPLSSTATAAVQGTGAGDAPLEGVAGTATGDSPPVPGAELLAQIRLARSGAGNDGNANKDPRLNPATAGSTLPGGLAPAAGTLARLLGGDLAGNGTALNSPSTPGLALGPELALTGESPPGLGPDGELISQFALDAGRRADTGSISVTGHTATAGQPTPGTLSGVLNPTASALPPLPTFGDQAAWSRAVGERLMALQGQGIQSARLKLYPEYLGELDVRIRIEEGQAQVWFNANHAQAREAIEASLPKLKEMFAESGLDLVRAQVDSGPGDGSPRQGSSGGFGEGFDDGFLGDGRGNSLPGWASQAAPTATAGLGRSGAHAFTAQGAGRLNVLA